MINKLRNFVFISQLCRDNKSSILNSNTSECDMTTNVIQPDKINMNLFPPQDTKTYANEITLNHPKVNRNLSELENGSGIMEIYKIIIVNRKRIQK